MLLRKGVQSDVPLPDILSKKEPPRKVEEVEATQKILREYAKSGAVRMIPQVEAKKREKKQKKGLSATAENSMGSFYPKDFVWNTWEIFSITSKKGGSVAKST